MESYSLPCHLKRTSLIASRTPPQVAARRGRRRCLVPDPGRPRVREGRRQRERGARQDPARRRRADELQGQEAARGQGDALLRMRGQLSHPPEEPKRAHDALQLQVRWGTRRESSQRNSREFSRRCTNKRLSKKYNRITQRRREQMQSSNLFLFLPFQVLRGRGVRG